jgi:hypothetical protein
MTLKTILIALMMKVLTNSGYQVKPPPATDPAVIRGEASAAAIERVTEKLIKNPIKREAYAKLALVFGFYEGSWYADPPGDNDTGQACGVLQVHNPHTIIPGATCKKVRKDLDLGYEVGIQLILDHEERCGSLGSALTMYAMGPIHNKDSGKWECPKFILPMISKRCVAAGLSKECRRTGA